RRDNLQTKYVRRLKESSLLAVLLCSAVSAGCTAGSQPRAPVPRSKETSSNPIVVHVFEAQPTPRSSDRDLLIPASISVDDNAVVLAERDGRIESVRVQEGSRVPKGAVLAQFNDEDQRSQLKQAELEVSRLAVEEQQYDALVKLSRNELEREQLLAL